MAVYQNDLMMDAALDWLITNAERLVVCNDQPADYASANTGVGSGGNSLGATAVAAGDFTKADGDTSGRKVTVAAKSNINVTGTGDATHVALVDDTNSRLLLITTCPTQGVTSGGTMNTQAFKHEIADVAAA